MKHSGSVRPRHSIVTFNQLMSCLNRNNLREFILQEVKRVLVVEQQLASTMKFWHGGNLDPRNLDSDFAQKGGRYEYGPGLYLTSHYDTAAKYAKGSRKLYIVEVNPGTELGDVSIPLEDALEAVKRFASAKTRRDISERVESRSGGSGMVKASTVLNLLLNTEGAIRSTKTGEIRQWLIDIGADYAIVNSPFGWGETMLVLYNVKKIKNVRQATKEDGHDDFH